MIKLKFGLYLILLLTLASCVNYQEIKNEDIKSAFIANSSSTFKGYYYEGSDNSFHYFVAKWDFQKDNYFKIGRKNLKVVNKYIYPKDTKVTKIDLWVVNGELFAETQNDKLYLIK